MDRRDGGDAFHGLDYDFLEPYGKKHFNSLMDSLDYVPEPIRELARSSHESAKYFGKMQQRIVEALRQTPDLKERVERLMSIPGVGEITALTWREPMVLASLGLGDRPAGRDAALVLFRDRR